MVCGDEVLVSGLEVDLMHIRPGMMFCHGDGPRAMIILRIHEEENGMKAIWMLARDGKVRKFLSDPTWSWYFLKTWTDRGWRLVEDAS